MNPVQMELPTNVMMDQERMVLYQLFCEIFYGPPTTSQLEQFKNLVEEEWLISLRNLYPAFNEYFTTIKENNCNSLAEQWKQEYQSIFYIFNADGKVQAPLWESYYTSSDHSLFSRATYSLRTKLHEFNLQYELENSHPEDHLAVELDFLHYLINFTQEAYQRNNFIDYEKGVYTQFWLLKDHLLKWVPTFVKKVNQANQKSIYLPLSMLLLEILKEDFYLVKILKEGMEHDERFNK